MGPVRVVLLLVGASSVAAACGESFHVADASSAGEGGAEATSGGPSASGGYGSTGDSSGGVPTSAGEGGTAPGSAGESGAPTDGPRACPNDTACARGENCVDELCVPALATCAAQKNRYPASKDGIYWVGVGAEAHRAYCDMSEAVELCTDTVGEHTGRTRDSSKLQYRMTAVLLEDGLCKMWNVRGAADGYPLWQLEPVAGVPEGQTCAKLGFVADGTLGACSYGQSRTNCGYEVMPLHRYGNTCSGCELNDGDYDHWVVQGPIKVGGVLSNASGSIFTTCTTGP